MGSRGSVNLTSAGVRNPSWSLGTRFQKGPRYLASALGGRSPGVAYGTLKRLSALEVGAPAKALTGLPYSLSRQCKRATTPDPTQRSVAARRDPGPAPNAPGPATGVSTGARGV